MKKIFVSACIVGLGAPSALIAQSTETASADASAQPSGVTEIVVTGSRVVRDGYEAPTPVTVLGAEELQEQAVTRLVDVSRNLPQFRNQGGARSGSNSSANGGQGALNMRGLGANRNLIMLDRRRVVPSTGNGIVDVNILPSSLVERIDVVTGGASAAWGSDAVSGVVNFVLDTDFQGVKGELSSGVASAGDNEEINVSLAGGTRLFDDRANVVAALEYYNGGEQKLLDREWLAKKPGIINNPAYTPTNGQPRRLVVAEGIVASHMTHGGLINGCRTSAGANIANCPLRGIAFGPGGVPYQFAYGTYVNPTGNMIAPVGSDYVRDYTSIYDNINMVNASERLSVFSHLDYDLTGDTTMFFEGIYSKSDIGPSYTVPPYRFGTSATTWLSVSADNAFLPQAIKDQMSGPGGGAPQGPAFLNVGRINDDWFGNSEVKNENTTYRGVAGLKGTMAGGWRWDAYYQYGENTYFGYVDGNLITSRRGNMALGNVNLAVDAVVAPAGNAAGIPAGTIVCRSTLTDPGNGCVPLNIFGVGAASQAAIDYVTERQFTRQIYSQHVVEASLQGEPFSTWAGPVSLATGASFRTERIDAESDPLSIERAFGIGNPQPYAGDYDVKEGFVELVMPLADNAMLARSLDLALAGRVTDYSTSGNVFTWKAGATYEPIEEVRLRVTRSRDIRAPSLQELYTGPVQARVSVTDPFAPGSTTVNVQQIGGGNQALEPEIADTISGGIVYQPNWFPGFSASVDYYEIEIADAISTISSQQIVDRCFSGNSELCNQITRLGGSIIEIRSPNLNLSSFKTSGLDIEVNYRKSLRGVVRGDIGVRLLANYVDEFSTSDGVTTRDLAGSFGPGVPQPSQPKWTVQGTYFYESGPFRATVINRYIGSGVIENEYSAPNEIDDNHVESRLYTNLNLAYQLDAFGAQSTLFLNVDNIFDVKPPRGFGWGYGLEASPTYDVIGPMFKAGFRFKF